MQTNNENWALFHFSRHAAVPHPHPRHHAVVDAAAAAEAVAVDAAEDAVSPISYNNKECVMRKNRNLKT